MKIGQIIYIDDTRIPHVQTGIIVKKEYDQDGLHNWYEVLCNDGQNHVLPAFLLSPATRTHVTSSVKYAKKRANTVQACINHTPNKLHYIHNDKQTT